MTTQTKPNPCVSHMPQAMDSVQRHIFITELHTFSKNLGDASEL